MCHNGRMAAEHHPDYPPCITLHEAGRRLGCTERSIRHMLTTGKLERCNKDGCRRVRANSLKELANNPDWKPRADMGKARSNRN